MPGPRASWVLLLLAVEMSVGVRRHYRVPRGDATARVEASVVAQRAHGVDAGGSPGGHEPRGQRGGEKGGRAHEEHCRVVRMHAVELALDVAAARRPREHAAGDAEDE